MSITADPRPSNPATILISGIAVSRYCANSNKYGLLNRLLISHDLRNDSQLGYNIGYNKYENYDGQFIYSLSYSKSLGSFGVFFEIFGDETTENSNLNFDSGIIYLIDNNKQLDLSVGRGINNDLFYLSLGVSINIF